MPVLRDNPSMLLTEEEKKKRMFGSLKFIGRNRKVNDSKNTKEIHPRQTKSDVEANAKERTTINLKKTDSESKKKVQEEALRRSKRIEDVKSASETPKRRSTVDQARSRPTRRCALKASSTRYEISATVNTNEYRPVNCIVERIQTQEVLTSTNSVSTTPIDPQTSVRRNKSFEYFMRKHKRSIARKSPNSEEVTPKRVSSFYSNKTTRKHEITVSKRCSTVEENARSINGPRRYVGFAERRVVCAPSGREEMDSDEEIDEVDLPSVARNCFESARTVSRSPVQAPSLSGSHNDACSPNNESQLHELSAYLSPSPTITTADVESALRNANSLGSVPYPSSLENFVQSVTSLVSEFGYGNLQPRMSSSFSMSPPSSPIDGMNDRGIGPCKSLVPDLPPLDINLVQFFMQMWQMWNKAGEMAAAHVAMMNIVGAAQATLAPTPVTPPFEHSATRQLYSRTIVEQQVVSAPLPTAPAESLPFAARNSDVRGSLTAAAPAEPIAQMHTSPPQNEENDKEEDLGPENSDQDISQESAYLSTEPIVEESNDRISSEYKRTSDPNTILPFEHHPSEQQPQRQSNIDLLDTLRISSLPARRVPNAKLISRLTGHPTVSWPFERPLKRKNTQTDSTNVKRIKFAEKDALSVDRNAESDNMCVLCQQKEANTYTKPCKCAYFCRSCALLFWKADSENVLSTRKFQSRRFAA
ncbi:hypothetical protein PRIPAC_88079 [Pristionchus pacificus]|uniref:Uncharacterized protein n=1 Tax=Pristionchus pacificus TaxID=54126 RepID=A0A2A6B9F9_PRIPA|nr:hypothetical protein PRIPAC_88079 [Pristionchus pacificus]|eukprot:PDM62515.1 hypothetical protein PRIPAC_51957 [Pristionchus pacificus]